MKRSRSLVVAALVAGCSTAPPELLPPPFGSNGETSTRLFFPTGLAKTNDGGLLIANGNFNHAFDAGTLVSLPRTYLDDLFRAARAANLDCGSPARNDAACVLDIPPEKFTSAVMIGNYAGPLVMNAQGTAAFTGSRDSGLLNGVLVDSQGVLHCPPGAGDEAAHDCRKGVIDLVKNGGADGPYSIVMGDTFLPGESVARPAIFVSSITPHIESISSGVISASSWVAVLDMADPAQLMFRIRASIPFTAETAPGPMVLDRARRQLYLSGCYARSTALGAGQPGTGLCVGVTTNYLRVLNVDSRDAAADPLLIDLRGDVLSTFTTQLLLGDFDPVTSAPATLWVTTRVPDALARFELPQEFSVPPRVREVVPMPISPSDMVRISRGSGADLLAVVSEKDNSVIIVDTSSMDVVAKAGRLGDSPFTIQEISCPADAAFADSSCLATTVFGECRVGLIEVPKSQPENTLVRALAGKCPP